MEEYDIIAEVIDFGERYDAPPTFKGKLKCRIDPISAKVYCNRGRDTVDGND